MPLYSALTALVAGFLTAVLFSALFVWFYNRVLFRLRESILKKTLSLALLPMGTLLGAAVAILAHRGVFTDKNAALLAAVCVAGGFVVCRYGVVFFRRRALESDSVFDARATADEVGYAWLKPPFRLPMRLLNPVNQAGRLRVHRRELAVENLPAPFDGYRVLHLTDMHIHPTLRKRWYRRVVRVCRAEKPDILLFGGDFISRRRWIVQVPPLLAPLSAPDGVFYVRGNHDFWRAPQRLSRLVARMGWRRLSNEGVVLRRGGGELALVGLEEPYIATSPAESEALRRLPRPRLALVHTPDAFAAAEQLGCFAALAGHTHGGQVRLPLFGTTISGTIAGPGYASGIGKMGRMLTITSNGVGAFLPFRFLCPPEIVVLELRASGCAASNT